MICSFPRWPGIIVSLEHVTRIDIDGSETLAKVAREINAGGTVFPKVGEGGLRLIFGRIIWEGFPDVFEG